MNRGSEWRIWDLHVHTPLSLEHNYKCSSNEDIVEDIFGDIEDEHDSNKYIAKAVGDSEYLLSVRLEIDKVNEIFGIDLPESEEYKTIGGFILHHYQSFPKLNEEITIEHFQFKIVKSTLTKIELVRLKLL